ncbi:MAP7 domain-containing protein [Agrobacterium deltaense]|uniref:MAP7 domain-containing protein n=1 Tax=Agrobacterium deltaense TaxID=1183412 RepID=UPI0011C4950C|nr:MAP7 domain-containing protein [Agrobacterium deltaense]
MSKVESAPLPPLPGTTVFSLAEKDRVGVHNWIDGRLKYLLTGDGSYWPDGPKMTVDHIYENVKKFIDGLNNVTNIVDDPSGILGDKINEHKKTIKNLELLKNDFERKQKEIGDKIDIKPGKKSERIKTPVIDPEGPNFPTSYTGQYEINALKSIANSPNGTGEAAFRPIEQDSLFNALTFNEISRRFIDAKETIRKYENALNEARAKWFSDYNNRNYRADYYTAINLGHEARMALGIVGDLAEKILGKPFEDFVAQLDEAIKVQREQQKTLKAEFERQAKAEAERQAAAKAEAERQAAEKAEAERQEAARAEAARQEAARAEAARQEAARAEAARQEAARAEAARQEAARAEAARQEAARAEAMRREAAAKAERDRLAFEEARRQNELQMQRHQERLRQEEQARKESQERQRQWDLQRQREAEEQRRQAAADQARRDAEQERLRREMDSIRIPGTGNGKRPAPGMPVPQPRPGPVPTPRPNPPSQWRPGYKGFPVVMDMNGDGELDLRILPVVEGTEDSHPVFDWNGDGKRDATAWVGPSDGLLTIDLGADTGAPGPDGKINRPEEVAFSLWKSEEQRLAELKAQGIDDTGRPVTDLEGLRFAFDTNQDNILDNRDARWSEFRIWQDFNQNGTADDGELSTMEAEGIAFIDLLPSEQDAKAFPDGSLIAGTSSAKRIDGTSILVGDVALAYRPAS